MLGIQPVLFLCFCEKLLNDEQSTSVFGQFISFI